MLILATLFFFAAFQSNFYEQGLKALDEKRYQAAVENFTNAIAAEPKDFALHFNLALAYSLLGKDEEGIAEYQKALAIKPDLYQAELNLAVLLMRNKRVAEAVPYLTAAAAQKPKEFRPNFYLAESLSQTGQLEKAEQAYQAAIEIDPKSAGAEAGLGRVLANQKHLDRAAPHFQKAAALSACLLFRYAVAREARLAGVGDLLTAASKWLTASAPLPVCNSIAPNRSCAAGFSGNCR